MNNPPFSRALWNVGWRYLLKHPWQSALMILGIALGVAVVVAIDLANASASRAFELGTESVAGKATDQITGGPQGLDEKLYVQFRRQGFAVSAAPVMTETVSSPQLGSHPMQLLGIDPFADAPFRGYFGGGRAPSVDQISTFLTQPGAVFISADLAQRYRLEVGSSFTLEIAGRQQPVMVAGLLQPADTLSRRAMDGLILADISTAQELTGRLGKLDRIDLILPENNPGLGQQITAWLPKGAELQPVSARQGAVEQMTAAFRTNLTALSLLALLVGLFLIYNTMTFNVVQRRQLFGMLRCIGVTRREIFIIVAGEALVAGIVGAGLGIGLGLLLGQGTVRMVSQTVNDLYFTTTVRDVGIPISSLVKGALVGILATLVTAVPPAWEAASIPPRAALSRSTLEVKTRRSIPRLALAGLGMIVIGGAIFAIPSTSLLVGFAGTFAVIVGFAMLAAIVMVGLTRLVLPITGRIFGLLGKMAPRNLLNSLSRTSVAVASLMVAVAVTIGVGLMIESFRYTVIAWLSESLQGDVYISAPGFTATSAAILIDPQVVASLQHWPGARRADLLRVANVESPRGSIEIAATDNSATGSERLYMVRDGSPQAIWQAMQAGAVVISEPLANRLGIPKHGGSLTLQTPQGERDFPVVGIFYDYSSSQGEAVMSLDVYRQIWSDPGVTAVSLRLEPGVPPDSIVRSIEDNLSGNQASAQRLVVRANRSLREDVMAVFDRTFAITRALQVLATIVAFIGVLSALLLLQLEKQREVGILRAVGLTARQLWGMVMLETGLMGVVAGLLAMPAGYTLSLILVYIINRRSFGWTLQMALQPQPFLEAMAVAVIAALLAGIYPAYRLGKMVTAEAIRYE